MIEAIHHVQLTVPSAALGEAIVFYGEVLGLTRTIRPPEIGSAGAWFRVFDRDLHLGVEEGVDRHATRAHVALKVASLHSIGERLKGFGITLSAPRHPFPGYDRAQFRDPWGNLIELIVPLANHLDVDRKPQPKVHLSVALLHDDRVLLVREAKASMRDKWNLPGGHAERGEYAVPGAMRELLEETGVSAEPTGVLGLFSTDYSLRLVVVARCDEPRPIAGDEVLESRFFSIDEALALPDHSFINPPMMHAILARLRRGVSYPLDVIENITPL
jgi:ADP-ribose pyrophosphatase YjhB (NUDIX family)/catechol 2,3-dioxygenase-like lactoylglutathione lyase family enzyme